MKTEQPGPLRVVEVSEGQLTGLRDLTSVLEQHLDGTEADFLDEAASLGPAAAQALPEVADALAELDQHRGAPVVVLRLPGSTVSGVRKTPTEYLSLGERNLFHPDAYRALVVSMHQWYGYGFRSQQSGVLHNNVVSLQQFAGTPGHSASAENTLDLHTEDASYNTDEFGGLSPDFLSLHFFRNPGSVPTAVADLAHDRLPVHVLSNLREPLFSNLTNPGQGGAENDQQVWVPVVYGPSPNAPWMRFNSARMGLDRYGPAEREALETLRLHLESQRVELAAQPGDIVLLDNRRVAHGRPRFPDRPKHDGTDRWQRRLALAHNRERLAAFETSPRVVDPRLTAARL